VLPDSEVEVVDRRGVELEDLGERGSDHLGCEVVGAHRGEAAAAGAVDG